MEGINRLIRLSLVLCLVFYYVNGDQPALYGGRLFDFNQDVSQRLKVLSRHKAEIEETLSRRISIFEKWMYEAELKHVLKDIAETERTCRVSYKDYLAMKAEQQGYYEQELKNLESKMEYAKKKEINQEVRRLQKQIDDLSNARNRIRNLYEEQVQSSNQLLNKMKEEKKQLELEKQDVLKVLEAAEKRHSRVLDVLSATPEGGYKFVELPEKDRIEEVKRDMVAIVGLNDKTKQVEGLKLARTKLQALIPALTEKSKLHEGTSRKDMEDALAEMEKNTAIYRQQQNKQKKEIMDKLKNKGSTDFTDDEIAALEKINEGLTATDTFERAIAIRSAALKALMEVSDLTKECSAAIRDAESGDLAKLWADAFQGAKDQYQKLENKVRSAFKL